MGHDDVNPYRLRGDIGPALGRLAGITIQRSPTLRQGDVLHLRLHNPPTIVIGIQPLTDAEELELRARHTGRMVVRRGMAETLAWLGEDVEPESLFDGLFPVRGQRWDGERFVWPEELGHPCGHVEVRQGCGGCDPGAVEYVIEDGTGRVFTDTFDRADGGIPTEWAKADAPWVWPESREYGDAEFA